MDSQNSSDGFESNVPQWREVGGAAALELIEQTAFQVAAEEQDPRVKAEARAIAEMTVALGVQAADLTPMQSHFAKVCGAVEGPSGRRGFFSIPYEHRRPEKG